MKTLRSVFLVLPLLVLTACSDPSGAQRALDDLGLKNIQTTGYRWFGCDKNDLYHTGFTAVNPNGKQVSGVVCSGIFKGNTVRFD